MTIECVFTTVFGIDDDTMGALESWQFSKWVAVLTWGMRAKGVGDEVVEMEEAGCTEERIGGDWLKKRGWEVEECWGWEERDSKNGNRSS